MYCILSERRYSHWNKNGTHIRQLKENYEGERCQVLHNNDVSINVESNDKYVAQSTTGEIIAISDKFSTVLKRINYAQPSAHVEVIYEGEGITLERYYELIEPRIYRLIVSNSEAYGELIAMDIYEKGEASEPLLFDSLYDAIDYVVEQQGDDDYYYVSRRRNLEHEALDRPLGIESYDMTEKERDFPHLKTLIARTRQQQREAAEELTSNVE